VPETRLFPFDVWRRLSGRMARAFARERHDWEEAPGRPALREAIAHHVSISRAVACKADDIIVTSGTRQAFDLIARVLTKSGETHVAVEDPVFPPVRQAFQAAGASVHPVPVDCEGLVVSRIPKRVRVVCVSPSHQYPLGMAMSLARRRQLLGF